MVSKLRGSVHLCPLNAAVKVTHLAFPWMLEIQIHIHMHAGSSLLTEPSPQCFKQKKTQLLFLFVCYGFCFIREHLGKSPRLALHFLCSQIGLELSDLSVGTSCRAEIIGYATRPSHSVLLADRNCMIFVDFIMTFIHSHNMLW